MFSSCRSLTASLLPGDVVEAIECEKVGGKAMCAASLFVLNTAIRAVKAWTLGLLKQVDPNPGDGGCQLRGYLHLCSIWR